jgi:hypothetical protein
VQIFELLEIKVRCEFHGCLYSIMPEDIRVTTLIFRHSLRMLFDDRGSGREKLPYPALLFDGQLENSARLPAPAPSLISSPSSATPRNLSKLSTLSGSKKT